MPIIAANFPDDAEEEVAAVDHSLQPAPLVLLDPIEVEEIAAASAEGVAVAPEEAIVAQEEVTLEQEEVTVETEEEGVIVPMREAEIIDEDHHYSAESNGNTDIFLFWNRDSETEFKKRLHSFQIRLYIVYLTDAYIFYSSFEIKILFLFLMEPIFNQIVSILII